MRSLPTSPIQLVSPLPLFMGASTPSATFLKPSVAASRSSITITMAGSTFWFWVAPASAPLPPAPAIGCTKTIAMERFSTSPQNPAWRVLAGSRACAIGDYNNDGLDDLFLTYYDHNVLFRNNGDGSFTDVTREAGLMLPTPQWSTGCTFVDYDRDGHLDLFFSTYVDLDTGMKMPTGCDWKGIPVHCGPRGLPKGRCYLFHNDGHGRFTDVSKEAGVDRSRAYGFTAVAADFDDDGWPDIYVACDSTPSFYFRNRHDGTFVEEGLERGVALSEDGAEQAGMGIGVGDYKLDGTLGILKTHFADDTSVLYENNGKGEFTDVTLKSGLGVETRYVCWGAGIVDLDNDGLPDLFIAAGQVYPELEKQAPLFPYKNPRIVFRNLGGGRFEELFDEAGPAIAAAHSSRGCAFGDFDNDGDIDIVIMNMNEPPSLLRNDITGAKPLAEGPTGGHRF